MTKYIPPKIADLTQDQLEDMTRGVGIQGLPYPMTRNTEVDGKPQKVVGAVESMQEVLAVISPHLTIEQVNRELYTNMATESMLDIARHVIKAARPDVFNHLVAIFGDPSSGKTFILRQVGALVHPEGALRIDCGGMDVGELVWRPTIDYGSDTRQQLNERAAKGTINPATINDLRREFPNSITEKNGKVEINWAAIGEPKAVKAADGKEGLETHEQAIVRARAALNHIYEVYEGISIKENSFGFKYTPGEILQAFTQGRPIILDEISKCKPDSLKKIYGFLEFASGLINSWETANPMADADATEDRVFTMRREDTRCGWFVGLSGNEAKDGLSTFRMSESMDSRINQHYVTDMTLRDWEHRISQMLTGFPVTTFHGILEKHAASNPEGFATLMIGLSTMGMTPDELKMRPPHHDYFLRNFPETIDAAKRLAKLLHTQHALSNTDSPMFRDDKRWGKCADEVISRDAQKLQITSRKFQTVYLENALQPTVRVSAPDDLTLEFDLQKAFNNFNPKDVFNTAPAWHQLGARISEEIINGIMNVTQHMPLTRQALIDECKELGILSQDLKEAKPSKERRLLSDLLSYDPLKDKGIGNTAQAQVVASALQVMLKQIYPDIEVGAAQIPLENVAVAVRAVEGKMAQNSYAFALLNDDLDSMQQNPVVTAYSVPFYSLEDVDSLVGGQAETVPLKVLLASLTVAGQAQQTLERLWPRDMQLSTESGKLSDKEMAVLGILNGNSADGLDFAATQAAGQSGDQVTMYMLNDRARGKVLIIGEEEIPLALKSALAKNGISYYLLDDHKTYDEVDAFIFEGEKHRQSQPSSREEKTTLMIQALMTVVGIPEKSIGADMTFGRVMEENKTSDPQFYSRVVKPRTP